MNELISRQAAIDAAIKADMENNDGILSEKRARVLEEHISYLPSAQPKRKRGKWKTAYLDHEAMGERPHIYYCSVCCNCIAHPTSFCPNCGADMREEEQDATD